jgi:hypothetical protein
VAYVAPHQGYLQDLDVAAAADITARHTCSTHATEPPLSRPAEAAPCTHCSNCSVQMSKSMTNLTIKCQVSFCLLLHCLLKAVAES